MVFELKKKGYHWQEKTNTVCLPIRAKSKWKRFKEGAATKRHGGRQAAQRETDEKAAPPGRQCARVRLRPLRVQGGARTIQANYPSDWFYGINAK